MTTTSDPLVKHLDRERNLALTEARGLAAKGVSGSADGARLEGALMDADRASERLLRYSAATITSEPATYRPDGDHSFFADMILRGLHPQGDSKRNERLARHARESRAELRRVEEQRSAAWRSGVANEGWSAETRALTTAAGSAGSFMPPVYLLREFASVPRSGRTLADKVRNVPLPTDAAVSIQIPKLTNSTGTAVQAVQNTALNDATAGYASSYISCPVVTIAGEMVVSLQLLEEADPSFDFFAFSDLYEDYNSKVENQIWNGTGGSNITGLLNATGIGTTTYTNATPTPAATLVALGQGFSQVATARKRPPTAFFMAGRRWAWLASQTGTDGAAFLQQGSGNFVDQSVLEAEDGPFGPLVGLPTYVASSLPLTQGAGSNQDVAVATRPSDHILFESTVRTDVQLEKYADSLSANLRIVGFAAFTAERYPTATSVVTGSGMAAPTGY